jgi:hypothetical protein
MKANFTTPLPPRLSMDAYIDYLETAFPMQDPEQVRRQKEIEEQIDKPFSMVTPTSHAK